MSADDDRAAAAALLRTLDIFAGVRRALPIQYVRAFLFIALNEGRTIGEYAVLSGVSPSVMSRHVLDLGQQTRSREPGMDLVYTKPNALNRREHTAWLTPKGHALLSQAVAAAARAKEET